MLVSMVGREERFGYRDQMREESAESVPSGASIFVAMEGCQRLGIMQAPGVKTVVGAVVDDVQR